MVNHISTKYYRVYKNDTAVSEVSINDFKPPMHRNFKKEQLTGNSVDELFSIPYHLYFLPPDADMFYEYPNKIHAMEMAKSGALKYIQILINQKEKGIDGLKQYRIDHYEDLNINLLDRNIQKFKEEIIKK